MTAPTKLRAYTVRACATRRTDHDAYWLVIATDAHAAAAIVDDHLESRRGDADWQPMDDGVDEIIGTEVIDVAEVTTESPEPIQRSAATLARPGTAAAEELTDNTRRALTGDPRPAWAMTRAEFDALPFEERAKIKLPGHGANASHSNFHYFIIWEALTHGEPVPPYVLDSYPPETRTHFADAICIGKNFKAMEDTP